MSLNVLILAEDPVVDGYVLKPIIEAMMKAVGKPQAYVEVCKDPRFRGTSQALKWEFVQQALSRNEGMFHLYLLCVDRDGDANRQVELDHLEKQAKTVIGRRPSIPGGKCLAGSGGLAAHGPRSTS